MKDNEMKFNLPMLESPRTVRIRFRKMGNLQYISHLDLQRTFSRVLVRAGLPLWYTKGFNPHIKMVFGMPLPVGAESECEFLDIRIEREMSDEEIKARLNAELTHELAVAEVYPAQTHFREIAFAEYEYRIQTPSAEVDVARVHAALTSRPLTVCKRSKSGEREVDLLDFVKRFTVEATEGELCICAVLAAGEGNYLNPDLLISALRDKVGILSGNEPYRIVRRRALLADGEKEFF